MNKPDWKDASVLHPEAQVVLNKILDHLTGQRGRALDTTCPDPNTCCYRGGNGTMCAVGCLIPNELYDTSIEGNVGEIFNAMDAQGANPLMRRVAAHLLSLTPTLPSEAMRELYGVVQRFHDCDLHLYPHLAQGGAEGYSTLIDLHPDDDVALRKAMAEAIDKRLRDYHLCLENLYVEKRP